MTPFSEGVRIHDHIITPDAFTPAQLADAMYRLTADADDAALLLESCTAEEADAMLNPGADLIAEAVTAVKNRLDRTMSALVRVFARHGDKVQPYNFPSIGPDRKNALFAYKTVTFTMDDGQTVSILFHSPGRDPMKLVADDLLIAYRWMLNRRDITAIVSPEGGRDINLQTMARRIMQLVEENSEKFQANNEKRQEQAEALAKLESEQAAENEAVDKLTQQNADLSGQIEDADARIARLRERLEAHGEADREGSGAGEGSASTPPASTDVAQGVAARAGLEALGMGRGHNVDGIEYNRTGNGTEVIVNGQVAALVTGRLSKSNVEAALHQVAATAMAESLASFGEALQAQLNLPAGHSLEFETAADIMRRAETMDGRSSTNESVRIRRDSTAVGGYSGSARLIINDRRAEVAIFLTNEATGVTEDRATVLNGDNLSQLINRTAEYLNGKFAGGQASSQPEPGNANNPDGEPAEPDATDNSDRVADYLSRIEQAETSKDVGAIGIEIENDPSLSAEENLAMHKAVREARIRFSKQEEAERLAQNSPEQIDTPEGWQVSHGSFVDFTLTAHSALGVDSTLVSVKARNGNTIGTIERDDVSAFTNGDTSTFTPADNWKTTYSEELKQLMGLASPESAPAQEPGSLEALDSRLYRDISNSIRVIRGIDNGTEQGYNRSLFVSSISNKLKTQARNGNEDVVDAALLLISQQGIEHGKPILAKRNAAWSMTGHDMDYYMDIAKRQASEAPAPAPSEGEPAPAPEEQGEPSNEGSEPTEADRISAALQALLSGTDSTEVMDALETLMDEAEAAGIDIDNDPDMLAVSDHITALLEQEAA